MNAGHERADPPAPPRQRIVRGFLALLGVVALFIVGLHFNALNDMEAAARDFDARTGAAAPSDSIVLVTITEADYDSLFGGRSPLDVDSLGRLVRAIARANPLVIGLDLDTSHPGFRRLRPLADSLAAAGVQVVWARDAASCSSGTAEDEGDMGVRAPAAGACRDRMIHPLPVLGDTASDPRLTSALGVMSLDPDGTVRHYSRLVPLGGGDAAPSFVWALRSAFDSMPRRARADTLPRFIAFHPGTPAAWHLTAREALALAESGESARSILGGRAVVLGGTYRAARDDHDTPLGERPGVDVQARALETELRGGGNRPPSLLALATLQCVAGSLVIILLAGLPPGRAMIALVLAVPTLSVLGSLLLTHSLWAGVWYLLPLLTLVVIEQLYEKAAFYRELLVTELYHEARGLPHAVESVAPMLECVAGRLARAARAAERFARWRRPWTSMAPAADVTTAATDATHGSPSAPSDAGIPHED